MLSVWGNQACTQRPTGDPESVYIRIEKTINSPLTCGDILDYGTYLEITQGASSHLYNVNLWVDLEVQNVQLTQGAVIEVPNPADVDVTGFNYNFYADGTSDR